MPVKGAPFVLRSHFGFCFLHHDSLRRVALHAWESVPLTLSSTYDKVRIPTHHNLTPRAVH